MALSSQPFVPVKSSSSISNWKLATETCPEFNFFTGTSTAESVGCHIKNGAVSLVNAFIDIIKAGILKTTAGALNQAEKLKQVFPFRIVLYSHPIRGDGLRGSARQAIRTVIRPPAMWMYRRPSKALRRLK